MAYQGILAVLIKRLAQVVGAEDARELANKIPKLVVDAQGNVLDYDRERPQDTARLLLELCSAASGEWPAGASPQATRGPLWEREIGAVLAGAPPAAPPTRIMLVDDHALAREGLSSLIEAQADLLVVGHAGSIREAVSLARNLRPEVVLMDFALPDGTGDEATRQILAALPETKIVFLTVHDDDERLFAAISAGAVGYLLKNVRTADLLSQVRGVARGQVALSPSIGRRVLDRFARPARVAPVQFAADHELSEREVDVLRQIAWGYTNRQIADALSLSIRTVEYHRANLSDKLDLHSRADLVRYAARHGFLDSPDPAGSAAR